jgi:hypothetical protein
MVKTNDRKKMIKGSLLKRISAFVNEQEIEDTIAMLAIFGMLSVWAGYAIVGWLLK